MTKQRIENEGERVIFWHQITEDICEHHASFIEEEREQVLLLFKVRGWKVLQ